MARDNAETNPTTVKPETVSHVAEQASWVPLPSCSPLGHPFPIKSLALSSRVSPQTIHIRVLDKSPLSGPGRGPTFCNTLIFMPSISSPLYFSGSPIIIIKGLTQNVPSSPALTVTWGNVKIWLMILLKPWSHNTLAFSNAMTFICSLLRHSWPSSDPKHKHRDWKRKRRQVNRKQSQDGGSQDFL